MPKFIRKIYFKTTKFQRPIINLILIPCLLIFAMLFLYMALFYYELTNNFYSTLTPGQIHTRAIVILGVLWISSFLVLLWAYKVSNNLVGAFERILRELDQVLESGKKRHIYARKNDTLANELLQRINRLIDRIA